MTLAVQKAVHKKYPRCLHNFFILMVLWMIASVLNAYTFYFDLPAAVTILTVSLEYLSIIIGSQANFVLNSYDFDLVLIF